MLVGEETKRALKEIGLTEYEIRAYLYLLQVGGATANRLSNDTDIPYSKVYEVLNSLERKGWMKKQDGRPRLYYPKSPVEALEAVKLRLVNMVRIWEDRIIKDVQPLYERHEIREKPDVWILRGEYDTFTKIKEMIENAKNEVMIAVPYPGNRLLNVALPRFELAHASSESKVKFLFMFSQLEETDVGVFSKFGEIRVRDEMFGGGVISDGREALLILGARSPLVIWSDHLGLVRFAKDYFQNLWNTAREILKDRIQNNLNS